MASVSINKQLAAHERIPSLSSDESVETFKSLQGSIGSKKEDIMMKHYLSNQKVKKKVIDVLTPKQDLPII